MDIKPGDIVYLNTGSPLMSVREIIDDETIVCVWFDSSLSYSHQAEFHVKQVKVHREMPELKLID